MSRTDYTLKPSNLRVGNPIPTKPLIQQVVSGVHGNAVFPNLKVDVWRTTLPGASQKPERLSSGNSVTLLNQIARVVPIKSLDSKPVVDDNLVPIRAVPTTGHNYTIR